MRGLALALALTGCGASPAGLDPVASQNALESTISPPLALTLVLGFYGAAERAPGPRVRLVKAEPECNGIGWRDWRDEGRCVRGAFDAALPNEIEVAVWDGAAWSQTSLAHEGRHWLLWHTTGELSHDGDFYAQVERANENLWRSGQ